MLPGLFLLFLEKCEMREKLRNGLLNKKEAGLDGFENS